jgi:hypothetical protein
VSGTRHRISRNQVVGRWGTPAVTVGSVNEPREMEEHGVRFNEKWIYRAPRNDPRHMRERIVFWHRYNFVASFGVDADGKVTRELLADVLADLDDRLYRPLRARP